MLARQLRSDPYGIDLGAVVNKYIGETEKNLDRTFDAAEAPGVILLFDEVDALFGKRSEVKDSHDRYANIDVGYLLGRIEAWSGLAILTANLKNARDVAFLRRVRCVAQFHFRRQAEREAICRSTYPAATPSPPKRVAPSPHLVRAPCFPVARTDKGTVAFLLLGCLSFATSR